MRVFISYRRNDSSEIVECIYRALIEKLGKENVFLDQTSIEPGVPFPVVLSNELESCDFVLVIIGRNWLGNTDILGLSRITTDPDDWVRREVKRGLERQIVIPILIDDATMPDRKFLPKDIRGLALLQAHKINANTFEADLDKLTALLEKKSSSSSPQIVEKQQPIFSPKVTITVFLAIAFLMAIWLSTQGDFGFVTSNATSSISATDTPQVVNTVPPLIALNTTPTATFLPYNRTRPFAHTTNFYFRTETGIDDGLWIQINGHTASSLIIEVNSTVPDKREIATGEWALEGGLYDFYIGVVQPNRWYRVNLRQSYDNFGYVMLLPNTAGCLVNETATDCMDEWFVERNMDSFYGQCGDNLCRGGETCPADCGTATPSP